MSHTHTHTFPVICAGQINLIVGSDPELRNHHAMELQPFPLESFLLNKNYIFLQVLVQISACHANIFTGHIAKMFSE